jgi:hypothetical protein
MRKWGYHNQASGLSDNFFFFITRCNLRIFHWTGGKFDLAGRLVIVVYAQQSNNTTGGRRVDGPGDSPPKDGARAPGFPKRVVRVHVTATRTL